ncbi:MAG TPA: transcription-repair coupling factor, partial [Phenylobacterium sp.]|nr:transcription-repair coupling factor [Phenylobacterium sp.]
MGADGTVEGLSSPSATQLKRINSDPGHMELVGAPEGFDALALAEIVRGRRGLSVFIARDTARMSAFADSFAFFAPDVEVMRLPSWDCLPYDRIGPSPAVAAQRMTALARLAQGDFDAKRGALLVAAVPAMIQKVPPREAVAAASYETRVGRPVAIADLERYFAVNGYQRAST